MAHIVTLKDNNDEVSYPITPIDAVFEDANTTLSEVLNDKADTNLSNVSNGSVTTSKILDGAVSTNKIADAAVTSGKISLTTENISIVFQTGSTHTGTYNGKLIHLDDSGLCMLCYTGTTGFGDDGTGTRQLQWTFGKSFTSVLSASINSWYGGNVNAYMTYNTSTNSGGECYVYKGASANQTRLIRLLYIGYMS